MREVGVGPRPGRPAPSSIAPRGRPGPAPPPLAGPAGARSRSTPGVAALRDRSRPSDSSSAGRPDGDRLRRRAPIPPMRARAAPMLANAFLASSSERARSGSPCGRCRPISACAIPSSYGIDRSVAIACARPQERIASDVRPWSHASAIEHRVPRPCERKDGGEAAHPTERNGGTRRRFSRCLARLPQVEADLGRTAVAEERPEVGRSLVRAQAQRLLSCRDGRLPLAPAQVDHGDHA